MSSAVPSLRSSTCCHLAESAPTLRRDLRFVPQGDRSGAYWIRVELPQQARFFRLGVLEYELLSRLDGKRTVEAARSEAVDAYHAAPGRAARSFTASQVEAVVLWAGREGLLETAGEQRLPRPGRQRSSPLWIRFPITRGGPLLDRLTHAFGWLYSPWAGMLVVILWLMAINALISAWPRFIDDARDLLSPTGWIRLAGVWLVLKVLHELGHAVCCRRFGGEVGQIGVAWMLVAPVAYVDLTDAYRIRSRSARMMTSLAGVYIELIVAAIAALVWLQTDSPSLQVLLTSVVVAAGISSALFNLNPLMRLDGYFVLIDWLGRPNLSPDAAKAVREFVGWCFLGRSPLTSVSWGSRVGLLIYGTAAGIYRITIVAALLMAAIQMYGQAGLILAILIAAGLLGRPAWRAMRHTWQTIRDRPAAAVRLLCCGTAVGLIAAALLSLRGGAYLTTQSGWQGVLEFEHHTPLRAESAGFIRQILVRDGQRILQGAPIVRMENLTIQSKRWAAEQELATARAEERRHRHRNQTGAAAAQRQAIRALEKQLRELQEQEASLTVVAPRHGIVVAPDLPDGQDRWLAAGDVICRVVQPDRMKAIVAVPQEESDRLIQLAHRRVRIDCGMGEPLWGDIGLLPHHASSIPPHPALAASAGGRLATRTAGRDDEPAVELLSPHLGVEVAICNPPRWLKAGQPVRVYVPRQEKLDRLEAYSTFRN